MTKWSSENMVQKVKPNLIDRFFEENVRSIHYDFYDIIKRNPKKTKEGFISQNYAIHKITKEKFYAHSEIFKTDKKGKTVAIPKIENAFKKGIDIPITFPKIIRKETKKGNIVYYKKEFGRLTQLKKFVGQKEYIKYIKKVDDITNINKFNEKRLQERKPELFITKIGKKSRLGIIKEIQNLSIKGKNARRKLKTLEEKEQYTKLTDSEIQRKKKYKKIISDSNEKIEGVKDRIKGLLEELYNM